MPDTQEDVQEVQEQKSRFSAFWTAYGLLIGAAGVGAVFLYLVSWLVYAFR